MPTGNGKKLSNSQACCLAQLVSFHFLLAILWLHTVCKPLAIDYGGFNGIDASLVHKFPPSCVHGEQMMMGRARASILPIDIIGVLSPSLFLPRVFARNTNPPSRNFILSLHETEAEGLSLSLSLSLSGGSECRHAPDLR